tara:strand:+ start:303 stop:494 length:192 start_codon:yes stop_codon:yes gene_type:complete
MQKQGIRLISKVGKNKWKSQHSDGAITFHKTKKAAKEYKHTWVMFDPFSHLDLPAIEETNNGT